MGLDPIIVQVAASLDFLWVPIAMTAGYVMQVCCQV